MAAGSSEVDDTIITGEARHRPIKPGDRVYTGSFNFTGAIRVEVRSAAAGTLLDEIERLLENEKRPRRSGQSRKNIF